MSELSDHWRNFARRWRLQESPGQPSPEDIAFYERALEEWNGTPRPANPLALLLGVTPEITLMQWPAETAVLAVDQSRVMIGSVWPGAALGFSAVCARWTALPLAAASRDAVLGDGCFSSLAGNDYGAMVRSVRRVLRPAGLFVTRLYTRPERPESTRQVFEDLLQGRIGSFFAFKWRLAMALHGTLREGVRLADIWDAWHAAVPRPDELAQRLDWPLRKILTIDDYRGSEVRYSFPTLAEARAVLQAEFDEINCNFPRYELGERCPTLVLRAR